MEKTESSLLIKKNDFGLIDLIDCQKVLIQIIQGLRIIHKLGYLYCNIKPSNILIKEKE